MAGETRTTVYLRPHVYRALKINAAPTDRLLSDLINGAVTEALREDAVDLEAFEKRAKERSRPFEKVLEDLKRDGLLKPRHLKVRRTRIARPSERGLAPHQ